MASTRSSSELPPAATSELSPAAGTPRATAASPAPPTMPSPRATGPAKVAEAGPESPSCVGGGCARPSRSALPAASASAPLLPSFAAASRFFLRSFFFDFFACSASCELSSMRTESLGGPAGEQNVAVSDVCSCSTCALGICQHQRR